jgi:hypothetical protein
MTNYTIVESRSTAMPIAHPKLKRENKTDRSTKPCSNCGRLDGRPGRPLGGERAVDLIDRAAVFEWLAKSGHDDRVCVTRRWRDSDLRSSKVVHHAAAARFGVNGAAPWRLLNHPSATMRKATIAG